MFTLKYALAYRPQAERGRGILSSMFLVAGALGAVLALGQGLSIAYRYYDLCNQITYLLGSAEITPDLELKKKVLGVIKGAGMSSNEQDIVLERVGEQVRAVLPYRHNIELLVAGKQLRLASIPVKLVVQRPLTETYGKFVVDAPEQSVPVQGAPASK